MRVDAVLLTTVLVCLSFQAVTSAPQDGKGDRSLDRILTAQSADSSTHLSHPRPRNLNLNDIMNMVTDFRSVFKLLKLFMGISPPLRDIIAETSKKNAEFRILFKLLDGKSFSLPDIVDLVTKEQHSMWDDYIQACIENPTLQKISKLMNGRNPDVKTIITLVTGKDPTADRPVLKGDKYTVTTTDVEQNQDFIDFVHFILDNWKTLNKQAFPMMFNSPVDYTGILKALGGLNFNHYPLSLKSAAIQTEGKMAVVGKYPTDGAVDGKLANILHDILVLGPQIVTGKDNQSKARDDVLDVFHNVVDVSTLMLQTPSQEANES